MPEQAAKFDLGRVVLTPGAMSALLQSDEEARTLLDRHASGDWGDTGSQDWITNNIALASGKGDIMSVYKTTLGTKVWVLTEANREVTTILLPEER